MRRASARWQATGTATGSVKPQPMIERMIGRLVGTLAEKNPPQVLVDCNGVGYEVDVPMSTFYNLPAAGEKVTLLTHFVVREDAQIAVRLRHQRRARGLPPADQDFRRRPAHGAVGAQSGMSVADSRRRSRLQEAGRLVKVPGIGKKTAERLLLELKGKLGADLGGAGAARQRLRRPTSCRRWWRWATATRRRRRR